MKETFLNKNHKTRGAKMVPFAGYEMPVWFSSLKEEHFAVRKSVGAFDISHMGVLIFSGPNARSFVQKVSCNNLEKHDTDKMIYSMILNEAGGILDDVMMATFGERVIMVVNSSNKEKLMSWFETVGLDGVEVENVSETHGFIAVQGPESIEACEKALSVPLSNYKPFEVWAQDILGANCIVMRTGYTGELGCEIVIPKAEIDRIWDGLIESGITPCGLGARDTLRLEAGLPLYGQELSESITPLNTRYKWVLDFNKEFIGKTKLVEQKDQAQELVTVGLEMIDKGVARSHYKIQEGGEVCSGTMSPSLEKCIAMALVRPEESELGSTVHVEIRGKACAAKVVKVPFS